MGVNKYRLWDCEQKVMLEPVQVDIHANNGWFDTDNCVLVFNFECGGYKPGKYDPYKFIPLQSTGELDPQGNEIYEGDIIYVWSDRPFVKAWFVVYFDDGMYKVVEIGDEKNKSPLFGFTNANYEVCGNIYQDDVKVYLNYRYMLDNDLCNKFTLESK